MSSAGAGSRKGRNSVAEHCPTAPAVVGEGQDLRMLAGGNIKPSLAEWMSLVPDKVGQGVVLNGSSILQHASEREVATSVLLETEQQVVGIRCQLCMIQLSLAVQRLIALCRCIHVMGSSDWFYFTVLYASPNVTSHKCLWNLLATVKPVFLMSGFVAPTLLGVDGIYTNDWIATWLMIWSRNECPFTCFIWIISGQIIDLLYFIMSLVTGVMSNVHFIFLLVGRSIRIYRICWQLAGIRIRSLLTILRILSLELRYGIEMSFGTLSMRKDGLWLGLLVLLVLWGKLVARLEDVLRNEEILWFQRARTN
ncbi:hypothetical protein V6N12_065581 [Hibiscus sabdariffa]|uniref:Uncharacterized protein n=1 Tax=Hibiscus sabdariffa TaxID=183260 RepID=A0ABR2G948_9ROSI